MIKSGQQKYMDNWLDFCPTLRDHIFPQPPFIASFWQLPAGLTISEHYDRRFPLPCDSYCQWITGLVQLWMPDALY